MVEKGEKEKKKRIMYYNKGEAGHCMSTASKTQHSG